MAERGVFLVSDVYADEYSLTHGAALGLDPSHMVKARAVSARFRESFRLAHAAGVKIAFGTDAGVFPHGENARQFALYVALGMSPMEALQSATGTAADLLGVSEDVGTLEAGKRADLIAVAPDPVKDIRQLEDVRFVMKAGVVGVARRCTLPRLPHQRCPSRTLHRDVGSGASTGRVCLMRQEFGFGVFLMCLLSLVVGPPDVIAQDAAAAETAATEWLAHVDEGRYADSWTSAATAFKQAVTQEKWQDAAKRVRERVGAVKARTKASAAPKSNPSGAPPGDYVILQYSSVFELLPTATETVTAVRDADGTWRVVGYFVH